MQLNKLKNIIVKLIFKKLKIFYINYNLKLIIINLKYLRNNKLYVTRNILNFYIRK